MDSKVPQDGKEYRPEEALSERNETGMSLPKPVDNVTL